jgi:hypothetical protein
MIAIAHAVPAIISISDSSLSCCQLSWEEMLLWSSDRGNERWLYPRTQASQALGSCVSDFGSSCVELGIGRINYHFSPSISMVDGMP